MLFTGKVLLEVLPMMKKISLRYLFIFSILSASCLLSGSGYGTGGYSEHPYAEDTRLEFLRKNTYSADMPGSSGGFYLIDDNPYFYSCAQTYTEEEIASARHTQFDEQGRLIYMLGHGPDILKESYSYCEENLYEWDDMNHSCRYIYYKANSRLLEDSLFYVDYRLMFRVSYFQFREDGRLLSYMMYAPIIDSSKPSYYSEELYFDRGYQAEYDGDLLMSELLCYDYWGTNESGSWEHRVYQYDENGRCTLKISTSEQEILVQCYEYDDTTNHITQYTYRVRQDWEVTLDDGSIYSFYYLSSKQPMVKKVSPDGQTALELFYARTCDMGQQHYLIPEEVEATVQLHQYVVRPGDCLWKIAREYYGHGTYSDILYRANRELIGYERDLITPGTRLYLPEIGTPENTRTTF